jgi:elongator complex protein 3
MSEQEAVFESVCEDILELVRAGEVTDDNLESKKMEVCGTYSAEKIPSNPDLLQRLDRDERDEYSTLLGRKPVRTASGVSPIAVMTSPKMCPHGKCLYCPGGPASEFSSSQSYTGHEPAAARGEQNDYDPYGQVKLRLEQLRHIGHPVEKCELIVMGGTMTSRSHDYQTWFVKRALQAMNEYELDSDPNPSDQASFAEHERYEWEYLEDVKARNETGDIRCIGITFETKPDWCDQEQIDRMLNLGGTKVEVGVQTTSERINREMHRGHGVKASKDANKRLREAGFKVGFHMMPGQPGMTKEMCIEDFRRIFQNSDWKPDYLKIYPTLVVKGTRVYDMWKRGDFEPLSNEEASDLVAQVKDMTPEFTRIQRVQRDIPADFIEAGVWKSNLRQLARKKLEKHGGTCDCIRCREVGMNDENPSSIEMNTIRYTACDGVEHFIKLEDPKNNLLVGFCRLRFPDNPERSELKNAAIVRELHVYGNEANLGGDGDYQHRGFGEELMNKAEDIAYNAGYGKVSVISGIGVREYYNEKLGYTYDGPYMSKWL